MTTSRDQVKALFTNQEWRLNNLYYIQDVNGTEIKFQMNESQWQLWRDLHYCNVIPKARQLGFSTFIAIFMLDTCLFRPNTSAGIIDITLDDAKKKLAKIKYAYDRLPAMVKSSLSLVKDNTQELKFSNESDINVGTSHRGGTLQILHISEFGKIAAQYPDKAREIRTGAFGTIHSGQMIFVESTAEGAHGDFHDLTMQAKADQDEGRTLNPQDFKLHFFPWQQHPGYIADAGHVIVPQELTKYFAELEAKHGIPLTAEQKAWYVGKRRLVGPDDMWREYPATLEEAFNASIEGAYFKTQMTKMRIDGRICRIPFNPHIPVNTFWDIGVSDTTVIWFHQSGAGGSHALIDYFEDCGEGVDYYVRILREKAAERGFIYGKHYGPHDIEARNWAVPGAKPIKDVAAEFDLNFEVVPRISNKQDSIEIARGFLGMTSIDEEYCAQGIKVLDNYRKKWNERRADWSRDPLHDWASHGADALQTGACGFEQAKKQQQLNYRNSRRYA
ncbi:MAG: terminase [Pseudomonadota bacterium]